MCKEVEDDEPKSKRKSSASSNAQPARSQPQQQQQSQQQRPQQQQQQQQQRPQQQSNPQQRSPQPSQPVQERSVAKKDANKPKNGDEDANNQYDVSQTPIQFSYPAGQNEVLLYKNESESRDPGLSSDLSSYTYSRN